MVYKCKSYFLNEYSSYTFYPSPIFYVEPRTSNTENHKQTKEGNMKLSKMKTYSYTSNNTGSHAFLTVILRVIVVLTWWWFYNIYSQHRPSSNYAEVLAATQSQSISDTVAHNVHRVPMSEYSKRFLDACHEYEEADRMACQAWITAHALQKHHPEELYYAKKIEEALKEPKGEVLAEKYRNLQRRSRDWRWNQEQEKKGREYAEEVVMQRRRKETMEGERKLQGSRDALLKRVFEDL